MVNKLTNAVINNLQTSNKTVVGALNELNSNWNIINGNFRITKYNVADFNEIDENCIFSSYNGENSPSGIEDWFLCLNIVFYANTNTANTSYKAQITVRLQTGIMYSRGKYSDTWTEWKQHDGV